MDFEGSAAAVALYAELFDKKTNSSYKSFIVTSHGFRRLSNSPNPMEKTRKVHFRMKSAPTLYGMMMSMSDNSNNSVIAQMCFLYSLFYPALLLIYN